MAGKSTKNEGGFTQERQRRSARSARLGKRLDPDLKSWLDNVIIPALVRFEVQDLGTLVSMVREGLGVFVVPRVAFSATPPGVVLVPLIPRIRRELGFALRSTGNSA